MHLFTQVDPYSPLGILGNILNTTRQNSGLSRYFKWCRYYHYCYQVLPLFFPGITRYYPNSHQLELLSTQNINDQTQSTWVLKVLYFISYLENKGYLGGFSYLNKPQVLPLVATCYLAIYSRYPRILWWSLDCTGNSITHSLFRSNLPTIPHIHHHSLFSFSFLVKHLYLQAQIATETLDPLRSQHHTYQLKRAHW